jgi:threonine dehydrogenase-like Zn-dependent dehydrogenase
MRAIYVPRHGPPDVLEVRESPDPEPGPGEVRVRVEASGLNFAEVSARQGLYPDAPKPPCVLGYEVGGRVDKVGGGIDAALLGRKVLGFTRFGGHADVIVAAENQVVPLEDHVDLAEAASLPVNYLTAHHALFHIGNTPPGSTILLHAAPTARKRGQRPADFSTGSARTGLPAAPTEGGSTPRAARAATSRRGSSGMRPRGWKPPPPPRPKPARRLRGSTKGRPACLR